MIVSEVFSPGFAGRGRPGEASLQVRPLRQRSAECPLPGACAEGPRRKSLTTRRSPDQRRPPHPSTGCGLLVRKPQYYGRFYGSMLLPLLRRINGYLVRWARRKYRRLASFKRVKKWWDLLVERHRGIFAHWQWATGFVWLR